MTKKIVLYLGISPPSSTNLIEYIHCPLIQTIPRDPNSPDIQSACSAMDEYTHIIFTSKSAADHFCSICSDINRINTKEKIAIGSKTAAKMQNKGIPATQIAKTETAEGVIALLESISLEDAFIFWPHSSLSRSTLTDFFQSQSIRYRDVILYETVPRPPTLFPEMDRIEEIVFTSPSTVDAFLKIFGPLPQDKLLTPIGPITAQKLHATKRKITG